MHSSESEGSYCTGSRIKTDTGYVSSGFELIQMKVILKKIIIVSENGHRLIVKEDNLYLPNECQAHNLLCRAEHGIYMWDQNNINNCNFDFFRQATLTRVTTNVYVDHHNKILLTAPDNPQQITCLNPLRVVTKTSEGVWFTKRPKTKNIKYNINGRRIMGDFDVYTLYNPLREVSFHSVFQVSYNYLLWKIKSQLTDNQNDIKKVIVHSATKWLVSLFMFLKTFSIRPMAMLYASLTVRL